jgi:hypothetical protein
MINITKHLSETWPEEQKAAAFAISGQPVRDIPFPKVGLASTPVEIEQLAWDTLKDVENGSIVLIQAETSIAFALIVAAYVKNCRVYTTVINKIPYTGKRRDEPAKFVAFRDLLACGAHALHCIAVPESVGTGPEGAKCQK